MKFKKKGSKIRNLICLIERKNELTRDIDLKHLPNISPIYYRLLPFTLSFIHDVQVNTK